MDNRTIAERLLAYADFLEARDANVYRVQAYRRAAETIGALNRPVRDLVSERGRDGLEELPGIGSHLSFTIDTLVRTGEFRTRDSAGGQIDSEVLFGTLPGVGPRLARRIHQQLGIQTLEELEQAAGEGQLSRLQVGRKRLRGILDAIDRRLSRQRIRERSPREPDVSELLAIDAEYRQAAEKDALPTLAPRRFNPLGEAWLPLLETSRGSWHYRALFSNTALAHQLGQTHDWVVVYFHDDTASGQRTIVTETRGELTGRRIVRGREGECQAWYDAQPRCAQN